MSEAIIVAEHVSYRVDDAVLIDGVSLHGRSGELVALAGPNGAGKSTMLRLLAGDLKPESGTVSVAGLDTHRAPPAEVARARSVMRQGRSADVPFTAAAVVSMGRYPHRSDPDNSKAADLQAIGAAMERADIGHLAGRVFATLSGGEQTRVVIARILAQNAPVVLLDEPTTALDVAHQERVLAEIRRMANEARCVVAVLHDLNAAAHYADRIILLREGAVCADGAPIEVLQPGLLSDLYGQPIVVTDHPTRNCPLVLTSDE